MKKLFFAAALAVVAIGGAFATNAKFFSSYYSVSSNTPDIVCNGGTINCSTKFAGKAYDKPASDPSRALVSPAILATQTTQP